MKQSAMGSVVLCESSNHSQPHSDGEKFTQTKGEDPEDNEFQYINNQFIKIVKGE